MVFYFYPDRLNWVVIKLWRQRLVPHVWYWVNIMKPHGSRGCLFNGLCLWRVAAALFMGIQGTQRVMQDFEMLFRFEGVQSTLETRSRRMGVGFQTRSERYSGEYTLQRHKGCRRRKASSMTYNIWMLWTNANKTKNERSRLTNKILQTICALDSETTIVQLCYQGDMPCTV